MKEPFGQVKCYLMMSRRIFRSFLLGACCLAPSLTAAFAETSDINPKSQKPQTMDNPVKILQLDFFVSRCEAEVYINGIPIRYYKEHAQASSVPLLPYVIEGMNTLELVIDPGPTPSKALEGAEVVENAKRTNEKGFAEAKVVRYPDGVYPGDPSGEVLATLGFDVIAATAKKPRIARATFEIKKGDEPNLVRWAWVDAKKIDLKKDGEEIRKTVEYVWQCFSKGDYTAEMFALKKICLQEDTHAYPAGRGVDGTRRRMEQYLSSLIAEPDWGIVPLDPDQFDFRLCADGRLVQIISKDWVPTVRSAPLKDYGGPVDYAMFLGKVNGKFVALRP